MKVVILYFIVTYVFYSQYLFLIEETSHLDAETVDVPKVLSDTFKALIAAIFIDTGDLKSVWNICYDLMKTEIGIYFNLFNCSKSIHEFISSNCYSVDAFMPEPPKNPLKLL